MQCAFHIGNENIRLRVLYSVEDSDIDPSINSDHTIISLIVMTVSLSDIQRRQGFFKCINSGVKKTINDALHMKTGQLNMRGYLQLTTNYTDM